MEKPEWMDLGGKAHDTAYTRVCCDKARKVTRGAPFCVCSFRSWCPDHGQKCNGTHD